MLKCQDKRTNDPLPPTALSPQNVRLIQEPINEIKTHHHILCKVDFAYRTLDALAYS